MYNEQVLLDSIMKIGVERINAAIGEHTMLQEPIHHELKSISESMLLTQSQVLVRENAERTDKAEERYRAPCTM